MKDIQVLDRPASHSFYAVAGRLLFIESFEPKLAILIERLFAGWQLTPVSSPERTPDVQISFFFGEGLPDIPGGLSEFEVAHGGRCYTAGDEYYLRFGNSVLSLTCSAERVSVSVWLNRLPAVADAELARVTSFAVCAALRRFGLFELHSAGLVIPNSKTGVLIVGPSGSGKSTLTLQLATAGWGYLSDDELLLSVVDGQVQARGFRSFFALSGNGPFKHCVEPGSVFNSPPSACAVAGFLLFTAVYNTDETQMRELSQAETMARLIRACPWATYDTAVAGPNLELLSRLARQAKGFNLMAGRDLLQASRASQIISSVCQA